MRGLTSRVAPAIGASLAGFTLSIYPRHQLRVTIAIYLGARALEMLYNALERDGYLDKKSWWFGSWMLFPLAQGQLLHAFVFNRDCFPKVKTLWTKTKPTVLKISALGIWRFYGQPYSKLHSKKAAKCSTVTAMANYGPDP